MTNSPNTTENDLEKLTSVVYQKIGRNIVLLQMVELLLKNLSSIGRMSGNIKTCDFSKIREQQVSTIANKTMGQVAGKFMESIYSKTDEMTDYPEEFKDGCISFDFQILGKDAYEKRKDAMGTIVATRNELVHHFVGKWDWSSIGGLKKAEEYLDRQYDQIVNEYNCLQNILERVLKAIKELSAYVQTDEFKMSYLQNSPIIQWFEAKSRHNVIADRWTVLSTAANEFKKNSPEEVSLLKDEYGYKTLKEMLSATGLFEFCEETTPKGDARLLYRAKVEQP